MTKYEIDNWKKPMLRSDILDSMQRHLAYLMDGEEEDGESKLHHIGHIMTNCVFYVYHNTKGTFIKPEHK